MKDSLFWLFILALILASFGCPLAWEKFRPRHLIIPHQTKVFDDSRLEVVMTIDGTWEEAP